MDSGSFHSLPTAEVARIVRASGTRVCVFPTNGTRRWLFLEYPPARVEDFPSAYLERSQKEHIRLYKLVFDCGIETLIAPIFGPDLMERGDEYMEFISDGLARIADHREFLDFYDAYDVRVGFYGDYRKHFTGTPYAFLCDLFDEVSERTRRHNRARMFYGLFANDPTDTLTELAVRYNTQFGAPPDKQTLIKLYYGDSLPPVDLFIGFDKFSVFDVPLLMSGTEDLYFTVSPSPYMTEQQLRDILYDHLYSRRDSEPDYYALPFEGWEEMRDFYRANRGKTLGVGAKHPRWGFWHPLPQVEFFDHQNNMQSAELVSKDT